MVTLIPDTYIHSSRTIESMKDGAHGYMVPWGCFQYDIGSNEYFLHPKYIFEDITQPRGTLTAPVERINQEWRFFLPLDYEVHGNSFGVALPRGEGIPCKVIRI